MVHCVNKIRLHERELFLDICWKSLVDYFSIRVLAYQIV
jgi:hypothetical protein